MLMFNCCKKKLKVLKTKRKRASCLIVSFFEPAVNIGKMRSKTRTKPIPFPFTKRALLKIFMACNEPDEKTKHVFHT